MMLAIRTYLRDSRHFLISLFLTTVFLGLVTTLFSDGFQYGLNMDDWWHKLQAYDLESGQWKPTLELAQPYFRPIGQVVVSNLANALPDQELPVRLFWAAIHFGNVCLAAFFAYRLVRSPLVLVTTGGVLLFPIPAHEAIFWHSGAASALLGTLVALVSVHLFLGAMSTDKKWTAYAVLGLAVFALIPQFYEQAVTCVLILPLLALIDKPFSRKRLHRALFIVLVAAGLFFLHWFFILRHSPSLANRGGVDLSLTSLWSERLPRVLSGIGWRMFGLYGLSGYRSAWTLGMQRVLGSPIALFVVALLAVSVALVVILASRQDREHSTAVRSRLILLAVGCLWAVSAFVPVLVVKRQIVESRLLYYAWVGLAFMFSAGIALLMTKPWRRWSYALALLLGLLFSAQVPIMAGFGQVYKLRYEHDQKQLAALATAAPHLPQGRVILVPWHMDEGFVSSIAPEHKILERVLLGVFQTDYSAASATSMMYRKPDIWAVTGSRWRKLSFEGVEGEGTETKLLINGRSIRAARSLVFSYQDGQVVLHDRILAKLSGDRLLGIELPLARQVGAAGATFTSLVLNLRPEEPVRMEVSTTEMFGDLVALASYSLSDFQSPELDMPGYALLTTWSCQESIPEDYTLYVHYVDDFGDVVAQDDHLLGRLDPEETLPTSQWVCPGYYTDASYVPRELMEAGNVEVGLGLWIPETGERLTLSGGLPVDQYGRVRLEIGE